MRYTNPRVIAQRKALVQKLAAIPKYGYLPSVEVELAEAIEDRLGQRLYALSEDGQHYASVWAEDIAEALEAGVRYFDPSPYEGAEIVWVEVVAHDILTSERARSVQTVAANAP